MFLMKNPLQNPIHERHDHKHEDRGEHDSGNDELRGVAARKIAFQILAALHSERGRERAEQDLAKRQFIAWRWLIHGLYPIAYQ